MLHDVGRTFQVGGESVHALRNVSLNVLRGEQVAIVGASGSGKSTLLSIIGMLECSSTGVFQFDGVDVSTLSQEQRAIVRGRSIGFVFQQFHLVSYLSAQQNVELPLRYQQVPRAERIERVLESLNTVGLLNRRLHLPSELSGGERQRTAIARALVTRPLLLLADEPTGALDSTNGCAVVRLMHELSARAATTLLVITHDQSLASGFARCVRLMDGALTGGEDAVSTC